MRIFLQYIVDFVDVNVFLIKIPSAPIHFIYSFICKYNYLLLL